MSFNPNEPRDKDGKWTDSGDPYTADRNIVHQQRELTAGELASIKDYMVGGAYEDLNAKLRAGEVPVGALKKIQEDLDAAIAASTLKKDMLLYRGFDTNMEPVLRNMELGATLKDLGFTSTSTQNDTSLIADSPDVGKIKSDHGKNALAVHGEGYTEVILPRNKALQLLYKTMNGSGGFDFYFKNK